MMVLYVMLLITIAVFSWGISGDFFSQLNPIVMPEVIGFIWRMVVADVIVCMILKVSTWVFNPDQIPKQLEKFLVKLTDKKRRKYTDIVVKK